MELKLLIEPQFGATYEEQLAITLEAERLGYPALMRSDHFVNTAAGDGLPGPSDAWVVLGALARETTSIRIGTLVTSINFRLPGPLAIAIANVDEMSKGRLDVGLGAGWFEREHKALGMPFPPIAERFDRLEEQLEILTGLWATAPDDTFSFSGTHYQLVDCPPLPRPYQDPHPRIICGGGGRRRTPDFAARFADEFNIGLVDAAATLAAFDRVRAACESHGRDPDSIVYSAATTVCCGATMAEARQRAENGHHTVEELADIGIVGTPDELTELLLTYKEVGAESCYLRLLDHRDLEQIQLIAAEVMPHM
jgi:alkanesulfonate monooxygenase